MTKVKIFFWTNTVNKNIASFRMRCLFITQNLKKIGLNVDYATDLISKPDIIILSKKYDVISINKVLQHRNKHKSKVLLDICDNHFVLDNNPNNFGISKKEQLIFAINNVDGIICSSYFLSEIIQKYNKNNIPIHVIEDVVEFPYSNKDYCLKDLIPLFINFIQFQILNIELFFSDVRKKNRLIWFGNFQGSFLNSGMKDLNLIKMYLENYNLNDKISLTIVSNSKNEYKKFIKKWEMKTHYINWNRFYFSKILKLHFASVIPVNKNDFTYSKSENRVTTSLSHGLKVIADPVPSYLKYNNYVYFGDWENSISKLLNSKENNFDIFNYHEHNQDIIAKWQLLISNYTNLLIIK